MRVAYVCADPGVPAFGRKGASVHVQEIVRALKARAEVVLFAARPDGEPPPDLEAVPVCPLPAVAAAGPRARERALLAANEGLRAALERAAPFDLVYERYSLWSHAGMEFARASGAPGLLEVNAPLVDEQARHRELADRAGAERIAARVFASASALVAVSAEVAAYLECQPAARGRVSVIPNGVDTTRFRPSRRPESGRPFTVGFVGSLKPWHGLGVLAEAFARLHERDPASRLLVVGDGPLRARLAADLDARGLAGAATLTGAVEPAHVPALLGAIDVAVAPYPGREGFYFSPLKVYEYMAAGLPIVASAVGQVAETVVDGRTGLLCPPGDPVALAGALERLRLDSALRARLGRAARACAVREHTWAAAAGRILELAAGPAAPALAGRRFG